MIDIFIDELTNSIVETATGNIFETLISEATIEDLQQIKGWNFDWLREKRQRAVLPSAGRRHGSYAKSQFAISGRRIGSLRHG